MTDIAYAHYAQDNANNRKQGKGKQEPHAPVPVPGFIDWVADEVREAPDHTPDEI